MSIPDSSPEVAADAVLREVKEQLDPKPAEAWPALRRRLANLLHEGAEAKDFHKRLAFIEAGVHHTLQGQEDDSIFVLVQMLSDRDFGYSCTHALTSAVLCRMVAPLADISELHLTTLVRAALTMNMAMSTLQDHLAVQVQPVSEHDREQIRQHPQAAAELLRKLGVEDPMWLELVNDHHESPDGKGYPSGKTQLSLSQQLLHMTDLFIARISPRANRRGLWPNQAVSHLFKEAQNQSNPLGAIFAKQLGLYPPGTYVRLKTNEIAVVVRRGERVNTPCVLAITDPDGLLVSTPKRRETQYPQHAIVSAVSPEDVKIRLDIGRLLKRV